MTPTDQPMDRELERVLEESAAQLNPYLHDMLTAVARAEAPRKAALLILQMVVEWHEAEKQDWREIQKNTGEDCSGETHAHDISAQHFRQLIADMEKMG